MRMTAVYTLVPEGRDNPWQAECYASATGCAEHVLLTVPAGGFFAARKAVYTNQGKRRGYVACLDWDDVLRPGAVEMCERALRKHSAGCAFTFQEKIDADGKVLSVQDEPITRMHVTSVPESIHHLCVINAALVPPELFGVIERVAPLCIDWLVRAYVALRFGAVQVPILGYGWRMHADQTTRQCAQEFADQIPYARALARSWAPTDAALFHGAFLRFSDADLPNA